MSFAIQWDETAVIGLGGNLAFAGLMPDAVLHAALAALDSQGLPAVARSSIWRTPAWPDPTDPPFANAVAILAAKGWTAGDCLAALAETEVRFGRVRSRPNAPRTLDLDLLDFKGELHDGPNLITPHPRMAGRAFVMGPLAEIAPDWRHPSLGRTAAELYRATLLGAP